MIRLPSVRVRPPATASAAIISPHAGLTMVSTPMNAATSGVVLPSSISAAWVAAKRWTTEPRTPIIATPTDTVSSRPRRLRSTVSRP